MAPRVVVYTRPPKTGSTAGTPHLRPNADSGSPQRPEAVPQPSTQLPAALTRSTAERIGRLLGAAENAQMWMEALRRRPEFDDSEPLAVDIAELKDAIYDLQHETHEEKVQAHIVELRQAHANPRLIGALEHVLDRALRENINDEEH